MIVRLLMPLALWSAAGGFLWAQAPHPRFEAGFGFLSGQTSELVLRNGTYDDPVSSLVWDLPPALTLKVALDSPWNTWTSTRVEVQTAVPITTGAIVDEDWETGNTFDDLVYGHSTSTAVLTSRWDGRVEQTLTSGGFRLLGGGRVIYTAWEARGGEYDYSYVEATSQHGQHEVGLLPSGTALTYQQTWLIPYIGLEGTWSQRWSVVTLTLRGSPWTFCSDVDNHPLRNLKFFDTPHGGWYGQGSVELSTVDSLQWGVRLSGEIAYGAVGDTVAATPNGNTAFLNSSGAWFREFSLAVFVRN